MINNKLEFTELAWEDEEQHAIDLANIDVRLNNTCKDYFDRFEKTFGETE